MNMTVEDVPRTYVHTGGTKDAAAKRTSAIARHLDSLRSAQTRLRNDSGNDSTTQQSVALPILRIK